WLAGEFDLGAPVAVGGDREHAVIEEVRVPEPAFVPAGALAEVEPRDEGFGGARLRGHGVDLPWAPWPGPAVHHNKARGAARRRHGRRRADVAAPGLRLRRGV